jgi:glutathione S-transferase
MNRFGRSINAAVNPVSTAATRWWCRSALRRTLTGHGPTARQRRLIRHGAPGARSTASVEQMEARKKAIDDLLARDQREA